MNELIGILTRAMLEVEDLGVLMGNSFSSSIHCKKAASKARWIMIMRPFAELSVSAFAAPYNTLVRPHLEYPMQACSPNLAADSDGLEQIQRLATRLEKYFHRLPYEERLCQLGLHSLRRRHLREDLIVVYKMLSGELNPDLCLFFIQPVRPVLKGQTSKFCRVVVSAFEENRPF